MDYFQILVSIHEANINILIKVFDKHVLVFVELIPRGGITRSYIKFIFRCKMYCKTFFKVTV
jgi:hypothetical protein